MGSDINIDTKDLAEAIERSNQLAAENNKKMMEMMKASRESHQKQMDLLNEQINKSREESLKIMEGIKKEQKEKIEKYELEKKEKKQKKELRQKQANDQLINETTMSKNLILKECEEEFDKIKDIYCLEDINNLSLSDDLEELFYNFYKNENVKDIYLNKILNLINSFEFNNKIKCYNIQIIGNSGVGKSTLINALLREEVAKTTIGSVGTLETKEYTSKKFPFIRFIDTRGTELDSANDIYKVKENTLKYIEKKLSEKDPNKTIHCLFYCLTGNRFEGVVKNVLLELRKKYKNGNLPIIIVYTQNNDVELFSAMKSYINNALKEDCNTQLGDREEDINLVGVLAKKKENIINDERLRPTKPFGLDKLLMFLKLKAKRAFIIATINMIKQYCLDKAILLLENNFKELLKNINYFLSKENDINTILSNIIKNLFIKYIPKENCNISNNSEEKLKNIIEIWTKKIAQIHKKNLEKFLNESSEKISIQVDKAQYNVICQNSGVALSNIKDHEQYTKEGKDELKQKLEIKSEIYATKNFAKKLYLDAASKFKILFKESIMFIIENEKKINDLIMVKNNNISEEITNKIDNLINEIKLYQNGDID